MIRVVVAGAVLLTAACGIFPGLGGDDPYDGPNSPYTPPSGPYCDRIANWDPGWQTFEAEVLRLTNVRRAAGADCHSEGAFGPASAVTANEFLRCSARNHSMDLAVQDYFEHDNLAGETPFDRIDKTGYLWLAAGENIAAGQTTPEEVIDTWMGSDGHCRNIMSSVFTELGVGYYFDENDTYEYPSAPYRHYWTQNFGTPR